MTYGSRTRCYICSIEMPFLLRDTEKRRARSGASFVRSSYYAYCQQVWYGDGLVGITREEACYRSDTGPDSRRSRWVQCQCRILLVAHNQSWPRLSCYLKHAKFAGCSDHFTVSVVLHHDLTFCSNVIQVSQHFHRFGG
jgi:hypothetical protein